MNRAIFFNIIRRDLFGGHLSQPAVDSINGVLDEWDKRRLTDKRWLAAMFATMLIEVGKAMVPVREGFKKTDAEAREYVYWKGYRYAVVVNGHVYYGRGLPQVTWDYNYRKLTVLAKAQGYDVDFVRNPDLLLTTRWAVWAMFEGMILGLFTSKKLSDYFNAKKTDWANSRRIINGTDRAQEYAGYARTFHAALTMATNGDVEARQPVPGIEMDGPTGGIDPFSQPREKPQVSPPVKQTAIGAAIVVVLAAIAASWNWIVGLFGG